MNLDYEALRFWVSAIQAVVTGGLWLYVWNVNRNRVTSERIRQLETDVDGRLDDHAQRLTRVEEAAKHGPTHDDLKRIHRRMDAFGEELKELKGEFHAVRRTLELIHEHLLNGAAK